jgi:hypothetical protein
LIRRLLATVAATLVTAVGTVAAIQSPASARTDSTSGETYYDTHGGSLDIWVGADGRNWG